MQNSNAFTKNYRISHHFVQISPQWMHKTLYTYGKGMKNRLSSDLLGDFSTPMIRDAPATFAPSATCKHNISTCEFSTKTLKYFRIWEVLKWLPPFFWLSTPNHKTKSILQINTINPSSKSMLQMNTTKSVLQIHTHSKTNCAKSKDCHHWSSFHFCNIPYCSQTCKLRKHLCFH